MFSSWTMTKAIAPKVRSHARVTKSWAAKNLRGFKGPPFGHALKWSRGTESKTVIAAPTGLASCRWTTPRDPGQTQLAAWVSIKAARSCQPINWV